MALIAARRPHRPWLIAALGLALVACSGTGSAPVAAPIPTTDSPATAAASTPALGTGASPATPGSAVAATPGRTASPTLVGTAGTPSVAASARGADCPTTPLTTDLPPDGAAASFSKTWHRGADGKVWASADLRVYAGDNKVLWARPAGSQLQVTGRRLDGDAPTLTADVPGGYFEGFQASGVEFPTPGCWEVLGRAGESTLRFVVSVYPRAYLPASGRCQDLADAVANSDAILVVEATGSAPDRPGFDWQTVLVQQTWKWPGAIPRTDWLDVLHDADLERPLERGHTYVLFLQSRGTPWRIFCPGRTLAEVSGERVVGLQQNARIEPLWAGDTLAGLEAQVRARTPTPGTSSPPATPKP